MSRICPRCGGNRMRASLPKSTSETLQFWMLRRPYRCAGCNARRMSWSWWWEPRAEVSRPSRSASTSTGFQATAVEDVRSAIREREARMRSRAGGDREA